MKKDKQVFHPLWEDEGIKICRFCAFAKRITATEEIFCEKKKQILPEDNSCKKYKYDILKKELRRRKASMKKHDKGEFLI